MNSLYIGVLAALGLWLGYRFYGKKIEKLWEVDPGRKTPATEHYDGIDYVPARHWTILFGHHFASIAGAGPIIGPVIAALYWGWLPALVWIVVGSILLGAVHDFSNLMISLRHKGRSIAEVTESLIGYRAKMAFATFLCLSLVLIIAVFAAVTAKTLVGKPEIVIPTFGLIGVAILIGFMIYRWQINQAVSTVVCLGILFCLILFGYSFPLSLPTLSISGLSIEPETSWTIILLIYAYFASILPVNLLLQPRDYLATFILYFGLLTGFLGLILSHPPIHTPALVGWRTIKGPLWPMLLVIISCGAISGFHSLVASGTTSKQLASERDGRKIAYGGMILEGLLATLALLCVVAGLHWFGGPQGLIYPELMKGENWILTFGTGFGQMVKPLFSPALGTLIAITMLNTFVLTTLDTGTRIGRYLSEELFGEGLRISLMKNRVFSTLLIIILSGYLALGNWKAIWPIFGASNQLVAALALMVITIYIMSRKKATSYTLYPCLFMLITTMGALIYQVSRFIPEGKYLLAGIGATLLILALFMVIEGLKVIVPPHLSSLER